MTNNPAEELTPNEIWRTYLTTGAPPASLGVPWYMSPAFRNVVRHTPSSPRCRLCFFPFAGVGGTMARHLLGVAPSKMNPTICNLCEQFVEAFQGGAEVETTVLFADVRGSTRLAETLSPAEFGALIRRFFTAATRALIDHSGMIEKLIGDEVTAFFVPGLSGQQHARLAVAAAEAILQATGHDSPGGPWVPVGVGVHTGQAFVGAVKMESGSADVVVLGDTANTGARLASLAGPGEVLISEAVRAHAAIGPEGWEARRLQLKGRSEPVDAWARRVAPS